MVAAKAHTITVNCKTGERSIRTFELGALIIEKPKPAPKPVVAAPPPPEPEDPVTVSAVTLHYLHALRRVGYEIDGQFVTMNHMWSSRRSAPYAKPRQVAMALCRSVCVRSSLPQIGKFYHRDHTTAIHACHRVGDWIAEWPQLVTAALATCKAFDAPLPEWLKGTTP